MNSILKSVIKTGLLLLVLGVQNPARGSDNPETPIGILLAVGDIARCDVIRKGKLLKRRNDEEVARVVGETIVAAEKKQIPIRVMLLGDLAYNNGTKRDFEKCFDPAWGKYKKYFLPVPGNHDHPASKDPPYFEYFKDNPLVSQNGKRAGYYSLRFPSATQGPWLLVGLNSYAGIGRGSPQIAWLESQLRSNTDPCVVAFAHPFRFSSGGHGHNSVIEKNNRHSNAPLVRGKSLTLAYRKLHGFGASVLLSGHDHHYEQFARQDADGNKTEDGIRSFIVGTGGGHLYKHILKYKFKKLEPNSDAKHILEKLHGVLQIDLFANSYRWKFIPTKGDPIDPEPNKDRCNTRRLP